MVEVQRATDAPALPGDAQIERWAAAVLSRFDAGGEVTIRLVDEDEGRALNARFRGIDAPTNVLAFPMHAPDGVDEPMLGDLALCAPLAAREAAAQGKTLEAHCAHLIVHGLLHLLGYEHDTEPQAEAMERLERDILFELRFPNPYERAG